MMKYIKIFILILTFLTISFDVNAFTKKASPSNALAYHASGDSITCGDAANNTSSSCSALGYVSIVAAFEHYNPTNNTSGIGGQQACDLSDQQVFPKELPKPRGNPVESIMIGTNDANIKGTGSYEAIFNSCHQASIAWLGVPSSSKVYLKNCTLSANWATDFIGLAEKSTTNGATATCTIFTPSGILYAWYREADSTGGTFTTAIDGGSTTSWPTSPTPAIATQNGGINGEGFIRYTGLTAANHVIVFTVTSSTSISNPVIPIAIGTPPVNNACCVALVGGVPFQQNDANSAVTAAYNTDVINNVSLLSGDGINVTFMNTRSFLNSTSNMFNSLHPNLTGHQNLASGFESVWKNTTP